MAYHRILNMALCVVQKDLLFIHSISNSLHLLTSTSNSIPPPTFSLLATTTLFPMSMSLFLFSEFFGSYFRFHIQVIYGISLWFTSLSMINCRFIHVRANGIISFYYLYVCTTSITTLLSIRNLNIHGFCYPRGSEPIPFKYQRTTVTCDHNSLKHPFPMGTSTVPPVKPKSFEAFR